MEKKTRKKRGRKEFLVMRIRLYKDQYEHVRGVAQMETLLKGKYVSANTLIRNAVTFVYTDNERLRDMFRREKKKESRFFKKTFAR